MSRTAARSSSGSDQLRRSAMMLGVQTGVVVALVVVAMLVTALVVVLRSQHSAALTLLQQSVAGADDVRDPPAGTWLAMSRPGGIVTTPGMPRGFPDVAVMTAVASSGQPVSAGAKANGHDYLVYTALRGPAVIQGVLDLAAGQAERDRLVSALLVAGLLGLVLAVLVGLVLARRAMRPLAVTVALQRRFVADASHELRTPLTLLSTRAQLIRRDIRRGMDAAGVLPEIDGLVADSDNLALVLEDLLVAVDPRGVGPEVAVDMDEIAMDVVAAFDRAGAKDQVHVMSRHTGTPVWVTGSPTALRRAVTAIVDNAVRHARAEVLVSVSKDSAQCVVEVSDDGPGIAAQMLPRLFDRHETTTAGTSGRRSYGLGLALVSDIVARHGGCVTARNRQESPGAILTLTLPLAPPP